MLVERAQSRLESCKRVCSLFCGSGEGAEGTAAGTPYVESLSCTTNVVFLGWGSHRPMTSAWGKAIAPPSGLPVTLPYRAHELQKSPAARPMQRSGQTQERQYFGGGAIPPLSY